MTLIPVFYDDDTGFINVTPPASFERLVLSIRNLAAAHADGRHAILKGKRKVPIGLDNHLKRFIYKSNPSVLNETRQTFLKIIGSIVIMQSGHRLLIGHKKPLTLDELSLDLLFFDQLFLGWNFF